MAKIKEVKPDQFAVVREETIRWIFSIICSLLVYWVVAKIAQSVYNPDLNELAKIAIDKLVEPGYVRPEPVEALLFRLGVITILPCLLIFYNLSGRMKGLKGLAEPFTFRIVSIICLLLLAGLVYKDFSASNPFGPDTGEVAQNKRDGISHTNFDFYFDGIFLGDFLWVYILAVVPLFSLLFLKGFKEKKLDETKPFKITTAAITYLFAAYCIVAVVIMNTFYFPYSNENKYDLAAVYYSMTQVFAGSPMLVDHFKNTYGLYPEFLNPVFQIIGMNIFKFSLVMSLLTGLGFLFNLLVLRKLISNNVILFLGFAGVLFFPYLDFKVTTAYDSIFSYYPVRYLVPGTMLFLASVYFYKPSKVLYWTINVVTALLVLWNPEVGMVSYLSWLAGNVYANYYDSNGKPDMKKTGILVGYAIANIIVVFHLYKLVIYLVYGSWPQLSDLFSTIFVFSKVGYGLLPMVLVHPWNIMALLLIIGFTYSFVKWHKKEVTPKSTMILLISLVGVGYFVYYQGRSQNSNFALSTGYSFMLLAVLGEELWNRIKNSNEILFSGLFVLFLVLISFNFIEIAYSTPKIHSLFYQEEDKAQFLTVQQNMESDIEFMNKETKPHEKVFMLVQKKNQELYFDGNKRVAAFNPGFIDLFMQEDIHRLEQMLIDSNLQVFAEPARNTYPFLEPSWATLAACYDFKSVNKLLVCLNKRKEKLPTGTFFTNRDGNVLHRKYTDDTASYHMRVRDAIVGFDNLKLAPVFSAEILYYTLPQMLPESTLFGNAQDSSGFSIGKVYNKQEYYVLFNGVGFTTQVPDDQWLYLAINVYPDRLEVYANGAAAFGGRLPSPTRPSKNRFYIGNLKDAVKPGVCKYYVGGISEFSISNRPLDSAMVGATWRAMAPSLKH